MKKRVLIKICGITSPEDGLLAAEAGADAVGFVFWAMSPRRVDVERAAAISRLLPPFVLRVGVFVDASRDEMARAADTGQAAGLLLDTRLAGDTAMPGGTGVPFDWSLVKGLRAQVPFLVLAGGLSPENVASAIEAVRPDAVDVSSWVEAMPGRKDPTRVRAFVEAVRSMER